MKIKNKLLWNFDFQMISNENTQKFAMRGENH